METGREGGGESLVGWKGMVRFWRVRCEEKGGERRERNKEKRGREGKI
jgi:hypothetical protein